MPITDSQKPEVNNRPQEENKADSGAKTVSTNVPETPENSIPPRKTLIDGSYREYTFRSGVQPEADRVFQTVVKTIGLEETDALRLRNELSELAVKVATYLQSDDILEVNRFLAALLEKTPSSGNPVYNLLLNLRHLMNQPVKDKNA